VGSGAVQQIAHLEGEIPRREGFLQEGGMLVPKSLSFEIFVETGVSDLEDNQSAKLLHDNEHNKTHVLMTGQAVVGWDWKTFALRGGVGYFGISDVTDDNQRFRTRYLPLPALDMRIGMRSGFRGQLGLGAAPIPGLVRWWSVYGLVSYRFKEGGEVGAGHVYVPVGTLDRRGGFVFHGMFPITSNIHVGGFAMVEADEYSKFNGFNWTAGGALRLMLDTPD
jgi:hypothetical protein